MKKDSLLKKVVKRYSSDKDESQTGEVHEVQKLNEIRFTR